MISAPQLVRVIGVRVGVQSRRPPSTLKVEIQRELERIRASLVFIESKLAEEAVRDASPLADETIVDQRSVPAPRDLYLKAARRGDFESRKHGKRILARWGDVRRALLEAAPTLAKAEPDRAFAETPSEDLDGLRRRLGLASKGT